MTKPRDNTRAPRSMRAAATSIVQRLQEAGHEALFAGGCVRDMLMNKRPHDYDVATSARPEEVIALFRRTQRVGAKFGVVLVRIGRFQVEVATFRTDHDYEDGRHPTQVHFTNARRDAQRRDFTINGMFYDPIRKRVVDYVGGEADLKARIIRAIGEPPRRFAEDHLRILRAIRFAARFDFTIDPATRAAMREAAPSIRRISPERIREELEAILTHPSRARAYADLHAIGVLQHLLPQAVDVACNHEQNRACLAALPPKARFELAFAVVLQSQPPEGVQAACDALRCSNQTKRSISWLVAHRDALCRPQDLNLADLKLLMARPEFEDLLHLFAVRLRAGGASPVPYHRIRARARDIPPDEITPPPLLTGHDLGELGVPPGPVYKQVLDKVYYAQLNGDLADSSAARAYAQRLLRDVLHEEQSDHGSY